MFKKSLLLMLLMAFMAPWAVGQTMTAWEEIDPTTVTVGNSYILGYLDGNTLYIPTHNSGTSTCTTITFTLRNGVYTTTDTPVTIDVETGKKLKVNGYYIYGGSSSNLDAATTWSSSDSRNFTIGKSGNYANLTYSASNRTYHLYYNTTYNLLYTSNKTSAAQDPNLKFYQQTTLSTDPSISIDPTTIKLQENGTATLTATVYNVPNATVNWTIEGDAVTVSPTSGTINNEGITTTTVTAVDLGTATITATIGETEYTATCAVTVANEILMHEGEVTTCNATFYDDGGSTGNYTANNYTMTIKPGTYGSMVRVIFNSFNMESSSSYYDYLEIYNGISTDEEIKIGKYITNPGTITASNETGALTFKFTQDGYGFAAGWNATVSCYTPDPLALTAATSITHNSATVNWIGGVATYTVEYKKHSDTDWTTGSTTVSTTSYELTGLDAETAYDVKVTDGNNAVVSQENYFATNVTPLAITAVTGVTHNTATVNWIGGKAPYSVYYKINGESWGEPAGTNITTTSFSLPTTLAGNTIYDVKVTDALDNSIEQPNYFTTTVFVDSSNPFTEGFTSTTFPPTGWSNITTYANYNTRAWARNTSTSYAPAHDGANAYSGYYGTIYLVMPNIQITNDADLVQLSFWSYTNYPDDYNKSSVVLLGDNETELWNADNDADHTAAWQQFSIDLNTYKGQTVSLAFKYEGNNAHGWYIDDVAVNAYKTYTKSIDGYTTDDNGWYLIASPVVEDITPSAANGFITSSIYDLYRFNQSAESEWENYKVHTEGFVLENGKGYLYANQGNNVTLQFTGTPYNGDGVVTLDYSTANSDENMRGWNLVGNPFPEPAYVDRPFYKMNAAGSGIEAIENFEDYSTAQAIPAFTGIFVQTTDFEFSTDINTVKFSISEPESSTGNNGNIQMTLAQQATNRGNATTLDNAIVSFNEGSKLGKFYFMQQNANLYIPQGNEEYAIVSSEAQGEMPVNFKANEDGQYTLTVNPENVDMNYLHLIDNMTGADIDLLQNPSYSFNATTNDYESRFKLVFAASDASTGSASDATFAFYSNGNWIVSNEGQATLQVVDINGRILSSETVNGSVSKSINATPGVYMIRLINGENVKVQKIVVR